MTKFKWTAGQKSQCQPGATVCVEGSPTYDAGRYVVAGQLEGFVIVLVGGVNASVPWSRVDPSTLSAAPDQRQMRMFDD